MSLVHSNEIDFAALMRRVARRLLAEPNKKMSSAKELRFGTHGSMAIDLDKGTLFDHETHTGADMRSGTCYRKLPKPP